MNRKLFLLLTACLLFLTACTQKMNPVNPTDTPAPTGTPILTPTPTPTPRIALEKQVSYDTVTVNGLQEIQCGEDKGIALDLNGDGAVEQIYLAPEGIYINNYLEELNYSWENAGVSYWEKFWIVDLNTADNYINLIVRFDDGDDTEALVYYDGSLRELARLDCFGGNSAYSTAEYNGDGTFVVQSRQQNLMNMSYFSPVTYSLNEDNRIIQLDEFVQLKRAYPLELLKEL